MKHITPRESCIEDVHAILKKVLVPLYGETAEKVHRNLVAKMRTPRDPNDPSNDTVRGIDGAILEDVPTAHFDGDDRGHHDEIPGDLSGILMQLAVSPGSEPNEGASKQELKCIAAIAHHIKWATKILKRYRERQFTAGICGQEV